MLCPICGEYGDLVVARVKKTGKKVIVCTECDSLWKDIEVELLANNAMDVSQFLSESGLAPTWDELEILEKVRR